MNSKQNRIKVSILLALIMIIQMSIPVVFADGEGEPSRTSDIPLLLGENQRTTTGSAIMINNDGKLTKVIDGGIVLREVEVTEENDLGYTLTKSTTSEGEELWILTLETVIINGDIKLTGKKTIIEIKDEVTVKGSITRAGYDPINLEIKGSGTLNLEDISGGSNNDIVSISSGITINVEGNIFLGGSGGQDGTLIVDGNEAILNIKTLFGPGIYCDTVRVSNGANLTVESDDIGVRALTGGITVENSSILQANCNYGVYIIDGKLSVDDTSKMITNGTIAPFCIVDKSGIKQENEMLRLPGIPDGTKISSVLGASDFSGEKRNYWSLITDAGTLDVTEENNEPVTLIEAAIERYVFEKRLISDPDPDPTPVPVPVPPSNGGGSNSNDKKDDKKIAQPIISKTDIENEPESLYFIDVKNNDWFKNAVYFVANKGIINGIEKNIFGPQINTSRGMIVTIFWQMENKPQPDSSENYADVKNSQYFAEAVNWATENNIVVGYGNGNFGPNDLISREQMATILYQYCKYKNYDLSQGGMATREFADYEEISQWALEYMSWAVNNQLISGFGNSTLDPRGYATRAQVSAILKNFYTVIERQK